MDRSTKIVVRCLWILVGIMVLFWSLWFSHRSLVASDSTPVYYGFENSFPLADAALTGAVVVTIFLLRARRPAALAFGLMAAGAGLYLFAMDTLYDLEHHIWSRGANGAVELLINVVTVVASTSLARWLWRRRSDLVAPPGDQSRSQR